MRILAPESSYQNFTFRALLSSMLSLGVIPSHMCGSLKEISMEVLHGYHIQSQVIATPVF